MSFTGGTARSAALERQLDRRRRPLRGDGGGGDDRRRAWRISASPGCRRTRGWRSRPRCARRRRAASSSTRSKLDRFKFVALDVAGQRVLFGHVDKGTVGGRRVRAAGAGREHRLRARADAEGHDGQPHGQRHVRAQLRATTAPRSTGRWAFWRVPGRRRSTASGSGPTIRRSPACRGSRSATCRSRRVRGRPGHGDAHADALPGRDRSRRASPGGRSTASAVAGADYLSRSGTATFAAGALTAQIVVPLVGDAAGELDETFHVVLSGPSGLTIGARCSRR